MKEGGGGEGRRRRIRAQEEKTYNKGSEEIH